MPGLEDLLKGLDLKKPNWTTVAVAIAWVASKFLFPDALEQENKFNQKELAAYHQQIISLLNHSMQIEAENKALKQDKQNTDSIYRVKVVEPAKQILKEQNHEIH